MSAVPTPPIRRVIVGMDFTAAALAAAEWTRRHFAPDAACTIAHALDVPKAPRFLRDPFPARDEIVKGARTEALERLDALRAEHHWGDVAFAVEDGRPEDVIARAARAQEADVVVVGEHARPRSIWSSLSSTAEALVRSAPVPVLLARAVPAHAPRHLLIAVDDSEHGMAALAWGRALAAHFHARATVLHVFGPVYLNAAEAVSGIEASRRLAEEQRAQARGWIEARVEEAGFPSGEVEVRLEEGDPAATVVAAQRGTDTDLVVMGSSGAGGAGRMLLGSVANGVLRGASCPVLVVRAED